MENKSKGAYVYSLAFFHFMTMQSIDLDSTSHTAISQSSFTKDILPL